MSKRFSVSAWRPGTGQFVLVSVDCDWQPPYRQLDGSMGKGWFCVSAALLGFGASLTCWRYADLYGDGGVA